MKHSSFPTTLYISDFHLNWNYKNAMKLTLMDIKDKPQFN